MCARPSIVPVLTALRVILAFGLGVWACYNPNFVAGVTKCATGGSCPNDWVCRSGVCVEPSNAGSGGSSAATGGKGGGAGGSVTGHGGTGAGGTVATGGTTGTGGSASSGGTTGTGGSTLSCILGGTYTPSSAIVTDFSDAMPDPNRAGQYAFGSRVGDPSTTASFASATVGTLGVSGGALTFTATLEVPTSSDIYPYNGFGVYFDGPGCANGSSYTGVSFTLTVTGTCPAVFMFTDTEHIRGADDPSRGTCAGTAAQCYPSQFAVTSATTMVAFNATPTVTGMPTAIVDSSKLTGFQWQFNNPGTATTTCSGSMTIDNIRLYQ